jgi:hypothetical protein
MDRSGEILTGPVGAALAATRRKAQRANVFQGHAAPPLRAGARIAAKAAPTGVVCGTLEGGDFMDAQNGKCRRPSL